MTTKVIPFRVTTVKPVLSGHSKEDSKYVFKTDSGLMQVKSMAECSSGKTFVLSIFEWPLKTGFLVVLKCFRAFRVIL